MLQLITLEQARKLPLNTAIVMVWEWANEPRATTIRLTANGYDEGDVAEGKYIVHMTPFDERFEQIIPYIVTCYVNT